MEREMFMGLSAKGVVLSLVAGLAVGAAAAPVLPATAEVVVPASLGEGIPGGVGDSARGVSLRVSLASIGFGDLDPGEVSSPVRVDVTNDGVLPLRLSVAASPLRNAEAGVDLGPGSMLVSSLEADDGLPVEAGLAGGPLEPGRSTTLWFRLAVPFGGDRWVPAGDYAGSVTFTATGVGP